MEDGEFQYVKGSHIWSGENTHHDYSTDYLKKTMPMILLGFKGKKG